MADIRQIIAHTRPGGFATGEFTFPNSHKGLNLKDSLADMPVDNSLRQVNLISRAGYMETRPGSLLHTTLAVSDVLIEDTFPPRLAAKPPLYIFQSNFRFEIPLLELLEAEVEPMLFSLVSASDSFIKVSEHGVLYGLTPLTTETLTHQAEIRVRDPARNALEFTVRMVILPLQTLPTPVTIPDRLSTPENVRVRRYPRLQSTLVEVDFDRVVGAEAYRIRWREKGSGSWLKPDEQPASYVILELPGAADGAAVKWEIGVQALKAPGNTKGASRWSARQDVPDQEGIGITLAQLTAFRKNQEYSPQVEVRTAKARGVVRYNFQFQQSGGDWTDGAGGAAGSKASATPSDDSPTVSLERNLPGAGWKFRLPNFAAADVAEGYEPPQTQGVEYPILDQVKVADVANFAAERNPDDSDATVDFSWDQHGRTEVTGYVLEISQNGTLSHTETIAARATVSYSRELAGTGWTARIRAAVPTGWLTPDWTEIDVDDQETTTPTGQLVATNLTATRADAPANLLATVNVSWTAAAGNTGQVIETKQGRGGSWTAVAGVTLTTSSNSATLTLPGAGWRVRIGTDDTQSPAQRRNAKVNVKAQASLGGWRPSYNDEGTTTLGNWIRSNPQNLALVAVWFHRVSPVSGEAGRLFINVESPAKAYDYTEEQTEIKMMESLAPSVRVGYTDSPGALYLPAGVQYTTTPARPAVTIRTFAIERPAAGTFASAAPTNADVNKNVTLTWEQQNDRDNRAKYTIEIKRKRSTDATFSDVTPISGPTFNASTGKWTAVCDADQRVGGTLNTTKWQFQVQMKGYSETPVLGAAYRVSDSVALTNTAPNHDPPTITTPLSATISGPTNIEKDSNTTYTASVVGGGTDPLTYSWTVTGTLMRIVGSATGSSVVIRADRSGDPPPPPEPAMVSFTLSLTVRRGAATATATLTGSAYIPVTTAPGTRFHFDLIGGTPIGFTVLWDAVNYAKSYEYELLDRSRQIIGSRVETTQRSFTSTNLNVIRVRVRGKNPASTGPWTEVVLLEVSTG